MQQEYFYHSFPRSKRDETVEENLERGVLTLQSIIKNGLLITPEVMELPFDLDKNQKPLVQSRLCFTLIPNDKLLEHMNKFGKFSIEWDTKILKEMGVIPTMYMSVFDFHGQDNLKYATPKFLSRLLTYHEEERNINKKLQSELSEVSEKMIAFKLSMKFGGEKRYEILEELLKEHERLEKALSDSSEKNGWYETLENLIYPVDSNKHNIGEGGYYNQREWRLIGNLTEGGKFVAEIPNEAQLQELLELNSHFFGQKIGYAGMQLSKGQLSQFFKNYEGRHILEYANKVIVPERYVERVKSMLKDNGLSIKVAVL